MKNASACVFMVTLLLVTGLSSISWGQKVPLSSPQGGLTAVMQGNQLCYDNQYWEAVSEYSGLAEVWYAERQINRYDFVSNCDFSGTNSESWDNSEWWILNVPQLEVSYKAYRWEYPTVTQLGADSGKLYWPPGANPTETWVTYTLGEDQFGTRSYGFVDQTWRVSIVGNISADWISWMVASYTNMAATLNLRKDGVWIPYGATFSEGQVGGTIRASSMPDLPYNNPGHDLNLKIDDSVTFDESIFWVRLVDENRVPEGTLVFMFGVDPAVLRPAIWAFSPVSPALDWHYVLVPKVGATYEYRVRVAIFLGDTIPPEEIHSFYQEWRASLELVDTTPPGIVLLGNKEITINIGGGFNPLTNIVAFDDFDGVIPSEEIEVTGSVNEVVAGTYPLSYRVVDTAGNESATVTQQVTVVAPPPTTWWVRLLKYVIRLLARR